MFSRRRLALACLAASLALAPAAGGKPPPPLSAEHARWLEDVELLIENGERKRFLALAKEYQRDAFIERFWKAWDPTPATPINEFKNRYYARLEEARERFGDLRDDRFRLFMLHGEPTEIFETNMCQESWPLETWRYGYSERLRRGFVVLFYQPAGGGPFRIWAPWQGIEVLGRVSFDMCQTDAQVMLPILEEIVREDGKPQDQALNEDLRPTDPEWLAQFHAFSTDVRPGAGVLPAELSWTFPAPSGLRVIVRGQLTVAVEDAGRAALAGGESFNLLLTGEVLRQGELFESFKIRFDLPAQTVAGETLPLVFERLLRPGTYDVVVRLEDLNSGREFRQERTVDVPNLFTGSARRATPPPGPEAPVTDAPRAVSAELVAEASGLQSGSLRFLARITGHVERVTFLLDGAPVLSKTRPPYSAELDLGSLPRRRTVRVVAVDGSGHELATDEIVVNPAEHSFAVRIVEPREASGASGAQRARVEVRSPPGRGVERVELYLNQTRLATLFQEPWAHPFAADEDSDLAFLRAVAFLDNGEIAEDLVILRSTGYAEDVEVRLVELFAAVNDRDGRPIADLEEAEIRVLESGVEQRLVRFERLQDLPVYAGLLIDTSASMARQLDTVRAATLAFIDRTIRERDRAAIITFSEKPTLATDFTAELPALAGALSSLRAQQATALHDSLVYGIYRLRQIPGQRALIVVSDGEDRASRHSPDEVVEFAQLAGVTLYTISIGAGKLSLGRRNLTRFAEATGGRAFAARSVEELESVYDEIAADLRSRYLLVYQSSATDPSAFRPIEVRVARRGARVTTLRGYVP